MRVWKSDIEDGDAKGRIRFKGSEREDTFIHISVYSTVYAYDTINISHSINL